MRGRGGEHVAAVACDSLPCRLQPALRTTNKPGLQYPHHGCYLQVAGPGQPAADFVLAGPRAHGVPGLLCCYGIESPGLTASLALAKEAAARLLDLPV